MGGMGSGRRPSYGGKAATEDSLPLDIRRLQRAHVLKPGCCASWQWTAHGQEVASIRLNAFVSSVTLNYNYTPRGQPPEEVSQTICLQTTACHLGGSRQWFACPSCAQRVAVIYGAGRLFGCRRCKGVVYGSQSETADDRAARRADRIRKKLGWQAGILNGPGSKPKGMHGSTYLRLVAQHDAFVGASIAGMGRRFGLSRDTLEDIEVDALPWR